MGIASALASIEAGLAVARSAKDIAVEQGPALLRSFKEKANQLNKCLTDALEAAAEAIETAGPKVMFAGAAGAAGAADEADDKLAAYLGECDAECSPAAAPPPHAMRAGGAESPAAAGVTPDQVVLLFDLIRGVVEMIRGARRR